MRGATLERLLSPTRINVIWEDEEWDELARRVWQRRSRHPDENLIKLSNAVQNQQDWPQGRKRKLTAMGQVKPLVAKLRQLDLDFIDLRDRQMPQLQDSVASLRQRPDKDTILSQLCPDEVCRRFTQIVFEHSTPAEIMEQFAAEELLASIPVAKIFAYVGEAIFGDLSAMQLRLAEHLHDHQKAGATNGSTHKPLRPVRHVAAVKPKVAVVGMQQHQLTILLSHVGAVCEIILVPKANRKAECQEISADHVILWETYASGVQKNEIKRQFQGDRLTTHRGTLNQLVSRIEALPLLGIRKK